MVADIDVSIIIVNYNGERFLEGCLDSIAHRVTCSHEVVLVDNASSDSSCSLVETKYPWVKIIRSDTNLGFAGGNNLGARYARGRFLLLLNNDTVLRSDIVAATELIDSNPSIAIVGANMLDGNGHPRPSSGSFPNPLRLVRFSNLFVEPGKHRQSFGEHTWVVDWVQGSFLLTTADNWNAIGGLDESYFMYVEDVDFCKRTRLRGFLSLYCSDINYVHYGGYGAARWHLLYSGHIRYQKKFHPGSIAACSILVLWGGAVARIVVHATRRLLRGESLRGSPEILGLLSAFRNSQ